MRYLERIFPWLLIAPVILPVVIWNSLIYPYLVPKTLLFYALSFLTLGTFLILAASGRAFYYARLRRAYTWIPAALLTLAYLASYAGVDFYRSFWSIFARGDGLLMLAGVVLYFYLILIAFNDAAFVRLTRAAAVVGSFVGAYGIGEWFLNGGRVGSLIGNAALFAGYLVLAFFATLLAARGVPRAWQRAAYVGAALEAVAVILSATRGAILALLVAALAALIYFALRGAGKTRVWSVGTLGALVIIAGLFVAFRSELAKVPFAPIARVASISTHDPDVASRLFIWQHMLSQVAARPVLGVGAEHVDVLFNQFYDPTQIEEQWFDRSHNAFLDYAVEYGVLGALLYLAFIALYFVAARREAARGKRDRALLLMLVPLAYATQQFFAFDTISSFWLFAALLAAALAASAAEEPATPLLLPSWSRYGAWALALMLVVCIYPVSVRPAEAAHDLFRAYLLQLIDPQTSAALLAKGESLGTYGTLEYGYEAYDMYVNQQAKALSGDARTTAYDAAESVLASNFAAFPYDARTALYLAQVLTLAPPGTSVDGTLLTEALARVLRESPDRYQAWFITANLAIQQANQYPAQSATRVAGYAKAEEVLRQYTALVPKLAEPYYVLAQLEYASGDTAGATANAARGKAAYVSDLSTATRAAQYYESVLDLPDAAFFLREVVRLDPSDSNAAHDLAQIQAYLSGHGQ